MLDSVTTSVILNLSKNDYLKHKDDSIIGKKISYYLKVNEVVFIYLIKENKIVGIPLWTWVYRSNYETVGSLFTCV